MTKMDEVVAVIRDLPREKLNVVLDLVWQTCKGGAKDGIALCLTIASALAHKSHQFDGEHLSIEDWQKVCKAAYDLPAPMWTADRPDA